MNQNNDVLIYNH